MHTKHIRYVSRHTPKPAVLEQLIQVAGLASGIISVMQQLLALVQSYMSFVGAEAPQKDETDTE